MGGVLKPGPSPRQSLAQGRRRCPAQCPWLRRARALSRRPTHCRPGRCGHGDTLVARCNEQQRQHQCSRIDRYCTRAAMRPHAQRRECHRNQRRGWNCGAQQGAKCRQLNTSPRCAAPERPSHAGQEHAVIRSHRSDVQVAAPGVAFGRQHKARHRPPAPHSFREQPRHAPAGACFPSPSFAFNDARLTTQNKYPKSIFTATIRAWTKCT
jgi:hypothetical protein